MESPVQLADRFREVLLSGKWIANTNFQMILREITREQAVKKVGPVNTIAALTFHINYYISGVLNVFEGGGLEIRDKYSFDFPGVGSEAEWRKMVDELLENAARFADHVENMSEEKLEEPFVDEKYGTYRRNIEGMIEHCYYHLGQISLIRKMLLV